MNKHSMEKYLEAQLVADFKSGDKVEVMFEVSNYAQGWTGYWALGMRRCVGLIGQVMDDISSTSDGVPVEFYYRGNDGKENYTCYRFPYFVLRKVENGKRN